MTLLERFDKSLNFLRYDPVIQIDPEEIRRAIAVAEAFEEYARTFGNERDVKWIDRRAEELLRGES